MKTNTSLMLVGAAGLGAALAYLVGRKSDVTPQGASLQVQLPNVPPSIPTFPTNTPQVLSAYKVGDIVTVLGITEPVKITSTAPGSVTSSNAPFTGVGTLTGKTYSSTGIKIWNATFVSGLPHASSGYAYLQGDPRSEYWADLGEFVGPVGQTDIL